jgi:hypothetical protein
MQNIMSIAANQLVMLQKIIDQTIALGASRDAFLISSTRCIMPSVP